MTTHRKCRTKRLVSLVGLLCCAVLAAFWPDAKFLMAQEGYFSQQEESISTVTGARSETATQMTTSQTDNVVARLSALRRGAQGVDLSNLTFNIDSRSIDGNTLAGLSGETGGGASADAGGFERLGVFLSGNLEWGKKDRTADADGFDSRLLGLTGGVDYRFLDGLVLGIALGYNDMNVDIDANGGQLDGRGWTSLLYGTYYATDHFYLEGSASHGWSDFDQLRNIDASALGGAREAKADYKGSQSAFMLGAGHDFIRGGGILNLYGRMRYVRANLDGYRERDAGGLGIETGSQKTTSSKSTLGLNYTHSISTARAVLLPQGWFEWDHEFDGDQDEVNGVFANDGNPIPFEITGDRLDSDSFRVGLGLGAQFGPGSTAFISYETTFGLKDYRKHIMNIGMRLDF